MTHLEIENLASDYLEGRLDASLQTQVEAHLSDCAPCRELLSGVRQALEMCQAAEEALPPPWLIPKILLATVGERKPTLRERMASWFRPVVSPRFAYAVAMAVFSFSIIVNAAWVDLRNLSLADLNPRNWIYRANSEVHLMYAHAEKFYYDLRVVYEIESRFRQLQSQPEPQQTQPAKPSSNPGGATTVQPLSGPRLAMAEAPVLIGTARIQPGGSLKP